MRQSPGARQTASFQRTMPDLPAGTITFLFTDTALWKRDRATPAAVMAEHIALLDEPTSSVSQGRVG
jgi:hypothetical protein